MFKLQLPPKCPPEKATESDFVLYRIMQGDSLTNTDLLSYAEVKPDRYSSQCKAFGISLFSQKNEAEEAYLKAKSRNLILGKYIGKLQIQHSHGKLASQNGSHFTLWLYSNVDASKIPCLKVFPIED